MAIKFSDADVVDGKYQVEITPQSKNETYEYTGNQQGSVLFQMTAGDWNNDNYKSNYRSFATKAANGMDLVINTVFYDNNKNTQKLVTTTIKNFYATDSAYSEAQLSQHDTNNYNTDHVTPNLFDNEYIYDEKQFTDGTDYVLASNKKESDMILSTAGDDTVFDSKGADYYAMNNSSDKKAIYDLDGDDYYDAYDASNTFVRDFKGNDTYKTNGDDSYVDVDDYAGNDRYSAFGPSELYIGDYKGNDTYMASDGGVINSYDAAGNDIYDGSIGGILDTSDSSGNDKYIKNNEDWDYVDTAYVDIYDAAGNDTYEFKGANKDGQAYNITGEIYVDDEKGNDKYTFKNTAAAVDYYNEIDDYEGNDNYEVSESKGLRVFDYAGNDKYNFHDMDDLDGNVKNLDMYIYDDKGNDSYTFNNVQFDNLETNNGNIDDEEGNDKYNLNSVQNLVVYDYMGNDTYTLTDTIGGGLLELRGYGNYTAEIYDDKGADKYTIKGDEYNWVSGVTIYDSGLENDTYTVSKAGDISLYDAAGNEKYTISDSEDIYIEDYAGKDTYAITDSVAVTIYDYNTSGARDIQEAKVNCDDKYDITAQKEYISEVYIEDEDGKETYNIKGKKSGKEEIAWVMNTNIYDMGFNNDTYNLQYVMGFGGLAMAKYYSGSSIYDEGGDDKYNLNNVGNLSIYDSNYDENKGSDKYQISGYSGNIEIEDEGGRDTYTIKGTKDNYIQGIAITDYGDDGDKDADTYNIEYVQNYNFMLSEKNIKSMGYGIYDNGGNNTFNIKNSYGMSIYTSSEEKAINKYNFTNATRFSVTDDISDGLYTISSSSGWINDDSGNDTYNISKMKKQENNYVDIRLIKDNGQVSICDEEGNDIYNVDKLTNILTIQDEEGSDILSIGGGKNDFVLMTNIDDEDYRDGSLLIYDKKNGGYAVVQNYFTIYNNEYLYDNESEGFIETINLAKKEVSADTMTQSATCFNNIAQAVAGWLYDNDYYDVAECLELGDKDDVATLVNAFANNDTTGLQVMYR